MLLCFISFFNHFELKHLTRVGLKLEQMRAGRELVVPLDAQFFTSFKLSFYRVSQQTGSFHSGFLFFNYLLLTELP